MPLALDNVQMSNSFNKVCAIGNAECFSIGIRCYSLQITNKKKTLTIGQGQVKLSLLAT